MTIRATISLVLFLSPFFVVPAVAQDVPQSNVGNEAAQQTRARENQSVETVDHERIAAERLLIIRALENRLEEAYSDVGKARASAQIAAFENYEKLLQRTDEVYGWQKFASNVMLALTCLVVMSGLVFSSLELRKALSLDSPQSDTNLDISINRIRITSSIVGVIILSISFFFLYLFLDFVYDIQPPRETSTATIPPLNE